ncbi:hypothetical protein IWZ00DRAFT_548012 [Phyllosticta capitalensis]
MSSDTKPFNFVTADEVFSQFCKRSASNSCSDGPAVPTPGSGTSEAIEEHIRDKMSFAELVDLQIESRIQPLRKDFVAEVETNRRLKGTVQGLMKRIAILMQDRMGYQELVHGLQGDVRRLSQEVGALRDADAARREKLIDVAHYTNDTVRDLRALQEDMGYSPEQLSKMRAMEPDVICCGDQPDVQIEIPPKFIEAINQLCLDRKQSEHQKDPRAAQRDDQPANSRVQAGSQEREAQDSRLADQMASLHASLHKTMSEQKDLMVRLVEINEELLL